MEETRATGGGTVLTILVIIRRENMVVSTDRIRAQTEDH
jgi:hypothetical protein